MFNWDTRYKVLLENWRLELENGSVLEVGCGPFGVAKFITNNVTGIEINEVNTKLLNLEVLQGNVTDLPFEDNSFDYVICSDVLEHLSFEQRAIAVKEIIRVAKKKCFINGPHGQLALIGDTNFKHSFERLSHGLPTWLDEHFEHGFPSASETLAHILSCDYYPKIFINETFIQHYSGLLLDIFYVNSSNYYQILSAKNGSAAIGAIEGDLPYALLFCIDKSEHRTINIDVFDKLKKSDYATLVTETSEITLYSIFHDAAYDAFSNISETLDFFKVIKPFFVTGDKGINFLRPLNPKGFFETQNDRCSELTALHYIWRNGLFSDIVGICHYRRYLSLFSLNLPVEDRSQFKIQINSLDFVKSPDKVENPEQIKLLLSQFDLLTGIPRVLDFSIENHYNLNHFSQDYYKCIEIMLNNYPYLEKSIIESMDSRELFTSNVFITNSELFNNLCTVWFDILEKCSHKINVENRSNYQKRDIAFLSERVFDILIRHLKKLNYKILELPIIHIDF